MDAVFDAKTNFDTATNARGTAFDNLKKLATRIVNALDVTETDERTKEDAKSINRKIRGQRAERIAESNPLDPNSDGEPTEKHISVAQQSYDSLVEHFTKLIKVVNSVPSYNPNEVELQTASLNTLLATLESANNAVIDAANEFTKHRISRDKELYDSETGLVELASEVKKYVKSLYGAGSMQLKQISGIKFTNYMR